MSSTASPQAERCLRFSHKCQKEHIAVPWLKSAVISLQQKSERTPNVVVAAPKGTAGNRRGSFVPKHLTLFTAVSYVFCTVTGPGVMNGNAHCVPSGQENQSKMG